VEGDKENFASLRKICYGEPRAMWSDKCDSYL